MSFIYQRVKKDLITNKAIREAGGYTSIPWLGLPKLNTVIPGIEREKFHLVTASPKVGKTKLTDFLFMYQPFKFIKTVDTDIKLKIFYFSLEISKEQKIREVIAHKLYEDYREEISPQQMRSVFNDYILSDDILRKIEQYEPYIEDFEKTVIFEDSIRNSYGIYKCVRNYAEQNGKYYNKNNKLLNINDFNRDNLSIDIDHYVPNNELEYVIIIVDHVSLLTPQKDENGRLHDAINHFSNYYCLAMRDRFKYIPVIVQQQVASQEELKFTMKGDLIAQKLRPSVDGLKNNL